MKDLILELTVNGKTTTDKNEIANLLNNYFVNVGKTLADAINPPTIGTTYKSYLSESFSNSIALTKFSPTEIINIVNKFDNKKSSGDDQIPMHLLKSTIHVIAEPLAKIINNSLQTGIFPDILKIAKICPIYKNGNKSETQNYRPISLLSSFSKLFEKAMHIRLTDYLEKYKILHNSQYGFRKNYATSMPLLEMYDKISLAIDNNEYAVGIFLDLSKAFDTVDHNLLLNKLSYYGVRGIARDWFSSYLNNRTQYVNLNGTKSDLKRITCGVPQGSILGSLLFIIFINDIVKCSDILKFILFADDTNLFYSNANIIHLRTILNSELSKLNTWFKLNHLSLNISKSNFILFGTKHFPADFELSIDGIVLQSVSFTKFLGVFIDKKLTWNKHIDFVATKIAKSIGAINRVKYIVPPSVLQSLYYTMIYPHLIYCIVIWGSACHTSLRKLEIMQKRIVRIMTHSSYLAPTKPLFVKLRLLKIYDIYTFFAAQFMFKLKYHMLPVICQTLVSVQTTHAYATRSCNYFVFIFGRTCTRQNSLNFNGPRLWDKLPLSIQNMNYLPNFNHALIPHLIMKYK